MKFLPKRAGMLALMVAGLLVQPPGGGAVMAAGPSIAPAPPPEVAAIPVSMLVDLNSGQILTERRPDVPFLPASVTKVMTAYVAFEEIAAGRLHFDQRFPVPEDASKEWWAKGTSMYLTPQDRPTLAELLHGIMTNSANDACIVLARGAAGSVDNWTAKMNAAARRLGMSRSHYHTPNGWMDDGLTYVTARDLVRLSDAMTMNYPRFYRAFSGRKHYFWRDVAMRSHDPTVGVVPGADGIKTGYTREAGYNFLGSAERNGRRLVMVLAGTPTFRERDAAARALLEWGFSAWSARPLFDKGATIATARVQGGAAYAVPMVADRDVIATLPAGTSPQIGLTVRYKGPVKAPIAKGQRIGTLEIRVGNLPPGHVPLRAGRDVAVAGPVDRLRNGFMNLLQ
ncbi:D-alanyl-D-alanine carboxypeptidase family protein [Novosphingobium colocasiae]|uniref:serine-type D-Ala-D-Ala carboxypeptidase n=1 Tax=Novosphingobium colocasiae TaxID=1256513 RepID=A0A918PBM7_9SPHN|nr:D-alanyl-D-alanine carboxypeptidase family protein [Novosphingobium colocasiae]GGY97080.1 D-alanyl-D-alanine carboxypeptidase [Novosphingobium colocasiae]